MKLPRPTDRLAGCVWLPRILSKARHLQRGTLPADYAANFCHPKGVDGLFLAHFGLSREDIISAATLSDDEVAKWFLARTGMSEKRIEEWNQTALNLGRPGYPMAERFVAALASTYKNVAGRGLTTVFEVLDEDEKLDQPGCGGLRVCRRASS
jgi:hypothetical protein